MLGGTHGVCGLEGFLGMKQHFMPDVSATRVEVPTADCLFLSHVCDSFPYLYNIHLNSSLWYLKDYRAFIPIQTPNTIPRCTPKY
jgi:hypothetical protein